jgi:hypothetical protein
MLGMAWSTAPDQTASILVRSVVCWARLTHSSVRPATPFGW